MADALYEQYMEISRDNGLLKREVAEMQKLVHTLQVRVKELNEELYRLRKENK
tara:strand:- start:5540 stop:5698 length:159 start_codon:yes stop_codon:yes gene_type:complete